MVMAFTISNYSIGFVNSAKHFDQSIFSSGLLATGYFVNTYIINNG